LKGTEIVSRGYGASTLREAATQFERAVALDPTFGMAWAHLSLSKSVLYAWATATPEIAEAARNAAEKAMALSPDSPKSYWARGAYERIVTGNTAAALRLLRRGLQLAPADVDLLRNVALCEEELGKPGQALTSMQRAATLDPRSWRNLDALAQLFVFLRRPAEARQVADRSLVLAPTTSIL